MDKETLLKIWLESQPSARSPYEIYGCPPMWETLKDGDLTLFTRPGKTATRLSPHEPCAQVDGVHYQWQRDGQWVGQGCQATFEDFERFGPAKIDIPPHRVGFDWSKRVNFPVLTIPLIEGIPSQEKALALTRWVRKNSDRYRNSFVKMYHATSSGLAIEQEGLKPTSATRRRSYQSTSGYVYLAVTPQRSKAFGDLGNGGKSVVYEVVVPIWRLLADKDQLENQRSVGQEVGDSIGESLVYGGGARVKGAIEPWAVRRFDMDSELASVQILAERAERLRRCEELSALKKGTGAEFVLWSVAQSALSNTSAPDLVDWAAVEDAVIAKCVGEQRLAPAEVEDVLARHSPGSVGIAERESLGKRVMAAWYSAMDQDGEEADLSVPV